MNTKRHSHLGGLPLEDAELNGVQVVRDPDGVWRYMESWIKVPGARDVTLSERFKPKVVIAHDGGIERYVVDGASVQAHPDLLGWCIDAGTPIREEGQLIEVLVPADLWEERDRVPNELISPEHEGTEAEREVAAAERQYREAEQILERAAEERAEALRRHAENMTRAKARELTGLSVGRIQQLIRSEQLESHEREMLEIFEQGPLETIEELQKRAQERGMASDSDLLMNLIRDLEARGLLDYDQEVGEHLTKEGAETLFASRIAIKKGNADED